MKILCVAPTCLEWGLTLEYLNREALRLPARDAFEIFGHRVELLISGIGGVSMANRLSVALELGNYDFVILGGIAGAYTDELSLGETVIVSKDKHADLGASDGDGIFYNLHQLNLVDKNEFPLNEGYLINPNEYVNFSFRAVSGLSFNTVNGFQPVIDKIRERNADALVESMEGAAFIQVCLTKGVRFIVLRSISNYVEKRNRKSWNMTLALESLHMSIIEVLKSI